jgi:hypothetical protein
MLPYPVGFVHVMIRYSIVLPSVYTFIELHQEVFILLKFRVQSHVVLCHVPIVTIRYFPFRLFLRV